jgi:DNA-3-methyladenine glycosylase
MSGTRRLGRRFFAKDPATLARDLLGCELVRVLDDGFRLSGVIVETEAYLGTADRAAHSFGGRRTARNEAMYARPGTAYVYFTYGMHHCFNVVCGKVDEPVAVLIRALEPTRGLDRMNLHRTARRKTDARPLDRRGLCSGPAKLCQALAIDRDLNGVDLTKDPNLLIEPGRPPVPDDVATTPRIGIASAGAWAEKPLRWLVTTSPCVSRGTNRR